MYLGVRNMVGIIDRKSFVPLKKFKNCKNQPCSPTSNMPLKKIIPTQDHKPEGNFRRPDHSYINMPKNSAAVIKTTIEIAIAILYIVVSYMSSSFRLFLMNQNDASNCIPFSGHSL